MNGSIWIVVGLVFIFSFSVAQLLVENFRLNRALSIATALISELFKRFGPDELDRFIAEWEVMLKNKEQELAAIKRSSNGTWPWFMEHETKAEARDDEPALH